MSPKAYLIICLLLNATFAQSLPSKTRNEAGRPFVQNYLPKEYGALTQNWAVIQDQRGIMFFANGMGALEYDGVSWRLIPGPNRSLVRSFSIDKNNRIYLGGNADFGYIESDQAGIPHFVSLVHLVSESDRQFGNVWHTFNSKAGVYFQGINNLFRYEGSESETLTSWKARGKFLFSALIGDELYVLESGVGILKLTDDSLKLINAGEKFAELNVEMILPYEKNQLLIGSSEVGLFLYDGSGFQPFAPEVSQFLIESKLTGGQVSPDGNFAFATTRSGVVLMSKEGEVLQILDKEAGLLDNLVRHIYYDNHGTMWLALDSGIASAEIPSPLSVYDDKSGLESYVSSIIRFNETLYVATGLGVYYLDSVTRNFKLVNGIRARSWWLLSVDNQLLVATDDGVYEIKNTTASALIKSRDQSFYAYSLYQSRKNPQRIYVGLVDGIACMKFSRNKWIEAWRVNGRNESVRNFAETADGNLWMGTHSTGALRINLNVDDPDQPPNIEEFGPAQNLPLGGVSVFLVNKDVIFAMTDGLFRFDKSKGVFVPDSSYAFVDFGGSQEEYSLKMDDDGNIWMNFGKETAVGLKETENQFKVLKLPFRKISDLPNYFIYPEDDGIVWFGSEEMLIRYNPAVQKNYAFDFQALIRKVIFSGDSVLFGGGNRSETTSENIPRIAFDYNALRFEYSASSFESAKENRYQTFLKGFDDNWIAWTGETKRDFTNLAHGKYEFHVRAKNIFQHESSEASFPFEILAPWYNNWWAYSAYLIFFGLAVFAIDRVQRHRVIERERQRSLVREAELRAESAEALAQSESERKKNIELLSEIGKNITASLDMDKIFNQLYEHINKLADATIFGVGIYHEEAEEIEYKLAIERGKRYRPYVRDTRDKNQLPVWCLDNKKPVFINDVAKEYKNYIKEYKDTASQLEDGSVSEDPHSLIYLPLFSKGKILGVITIQSYEKNAYTEYHLNLLENLATYTAIALDNAEAYRQLNLTLENLKSTQQKLVTQEKLASLGALTAGIAHEIKNPLNFVNNFAEISIELVDELRENLQRNRDKVSAEDAEEITSILADIEQNMNKINEHGKRADSIVKSMLQHSRGSSGKREETDINYLLEEAVNLNYHGMRAQDSSFNIKIEKNYDSNIKPITVVPQDISRVFLNFINNACYAAHQKKLQTNGEFSPTLWLTSTDKETKVEIRIKDNGTGIPQELREKLFQPFFTTKPAGSGTGLGLSISFDIITQEHGGKIDLNSQPGDYTEFIISIPKK
jgi:signal transduction histidine kinase/ligand-binding sensor domain-containing protein